MTYYLDHYALQIEEGATKLRVTSNAGSAKIKETYIPLAPLGMKAYDVTFPRPFKGKTRTLTVSYVLQGKAFLSGVRVNPAYVTLEASTQATDTASVKVIVPSSFEVKTSGGKARMSTTKGKKVLTSGSIKTSTSTFSVDVDVPSIRRRSPPRRLTPTRQAP